VAKAALPAQNASSRRRYSRESSQRSRHAAYLPCSRGVRRISDARGGTLFCQAQSLDCVAGAYNREASTWRIKVADMVFLRSMRSVSIYRVSRGAVRNRRGGRKRRQ